MPPTSNEDQFKFLISCIRYSNNGKVDFTQVATECNIVSKGAAAKRYERMMKAHGIAPNAAAVRVLTMATPPNPRPLAPRTTAAQAKKRKLDHFIDNEAVQDDDEDYDTPPHPSKMEPDVKEEQSPFGSAADLRTASPYGLVPPMLGMSPHGVSPHEIPHSVNNYGQTPTVPGYGGNDMFLNNQNDFTGGDLGLFGMMQEPQRPYNGVHAAVSGYGAYDPYGSTSDQRSNTPQPRQSLQGEGWHSMRHDNGA